MLSSRAITRQQKGIFTSFLKHPPAPRKGRKLVRADLLNATSATTHAPRSKKLSERVNIFRQAMVFLVIGV
jgi:hypothetical protein